MADKEKLVYVATLEKETKQYKKFSFKEDDALGSLYLPKEIDSDKIKIIVKKA